MSQTTYLSYIAKADTATDPHDNAAELYALMCLDKGQRRKDIRWNQAIAAVAQARCDAMLAQGGIFKNHLDSAGRGPNKWLRDAGVPIPNWYSHYPGQQGPDDHENNVESIGLNYATAALCWQAWMLSPSHREHCLGEGMFDEQTQVGIGYAIGTQPYPIFWVAMSAPPEGTP